MLREMRGVTLLIVLVPSSTRMRAGRVSPRSLIVGALDAVVAADPHLLERQPQSEV